MTAGVAKAAFAALTVALAAWASRTANGIDDAARAGRATFVDHGCVHCHREAQPGPLTTESPSGPDLRDVATRVRASWLHAKLSAPSRSHERMPSLLHDSADVADVVAYLTTLGEPRRDGPQPTPDDGEGADRFVVRGCVACHLGPNERAPIDARDARLPLHDLAAKHTFEALVELIHDPLRHAPDGRMPDLGLDRDDATVIARFLWDAAPVPQPEPSTQRTRTTGVAARGRALVRESRCGACHALPDDARGASPAPPLAALVGRDGGCVSPTPTAAVPHFRWTDDQRAALIAFLRDPFAPESTADAVARRLHALRCDACHAAESGDGMRDAIATRVRTTIGAAAKEHAQAPSLVGVGDRLRRQWIDDVLQRRARARPYVALRMPHYAPRLTTGLAALLAGTQDDAALDRAHASTPLDVAEAGRELAGAGALGCIVCHDASGRAALGIRGPDLAHVHRRLRPAFTRRWIADPAAVDPGTRMPTYFRDGKSTATHLLGGDAQRQIDALLGYLALGERLGVPPGMRPPADGVLTVERVPRVVRTILPGLDPRAFAIGFPDGLSIAFDPTGPGVGFVWQGGFLDMTRTWTGRGNGAVDLVGTKVFDAPVTPLVRHAARPARFSGYRVDGERVHVEFANAAAVLTLREVRARRAFGVECTLSGDAAFTLAFDGVTPIPTPLHDDIELARVASRTATPVILARRAADPRTATLWFPSAFDDGVAHELAEATR